MVEPLLAGILFLQGVEAQHTTATYPGTVCASIDRPLSIKQEDPLRSYSLVSAIVCLFVLFIVLKFVGNEYVTTLH